MTDFFTNGDDLSDFLGGQPAATPKALPQAPEFQRIRDTVPVFTERCPKCAGSGRFGRFGQCFACKGKGSRSFKSSPEQRATNRERAADRKVAQQQNNREHFASKCPAQLEWLDRTIKRLEGDDRAAGYRTFLINLSGAIDKYGDLTPRQLETIEKGIACDAEFAQRKAQQGAQQAARVVDIDCAKISAAFSNALANALRKPVLVFEGLAFMHAVKHPGTIYVKAGRRFEDAYYGKIVDGRFHPSRDCSDDIKARVVLVAEDPSAAAKAYGLRTGECSCCARELTNALSIELGIGPICRDKYGF